MASAYFYRGSIIESLTSTPSSGGNLALSNASDHYQIITGTQAHTVTLPDATTLVVGIRYEITNASTQEITVNAFGGALLGTIASGSTRIFRATDISTSAGTYDVSTASAGGGGLSSAESFQFAALAAKGFSVQSRNIKFNPDEVGGNFWTTKTTGTASGDVCAQMSFNGYLYTVGSMGSPNSGVNSTNAVVRFNNDNNYWLAKSNYPVTVFLNCASSDGSSGFSFGGLNNTQTLNREGYKYVDSTDIWSAIATAPQTLAYQACGFDGFRIYLVGGQNAAGSPITSNAYVFGYDTVANVYTTMPMTTAGSGRYAPAGFMLNGLFHFVGGRDASNTYQANMDIMNFVTKAVVAGPAISTAKLGMGSAEALGQGYIVGGTNSSAASVVTVEKLNPDTSQWTIVAPITVARRMINGGGSLQGNVYGVAGITESANTIQSIVESYTPYAIFGLGSLKKSIAIPSTIVVAAILNSLTPNTQVQLRTDGDNWKTFMSGQSPLKTGEALATKFNPAGYGTMAGGTGNSGQVSTSETYNVGHNAWRFRTSLSQARWAGAGFQVAGKSYAVAGYNSSGATAVALNQEFDDVLNTQTSKTALPAARTVCPGFSLNGFGHVAGGEIAAPGAGGTAQNTNYKFDPVANSWTTAAVLLSARGYMGAFVLNDLAYIIGGNYFTTALSTVDRYDYTLNAWANRAGLGTVRHEPAALSINSYGYAVGGYDTGGSIASTEKYNPVTNAWSASATLNTQRGRARSWIDGGYGHVAGGEIGAYTDTVEQFNDLQSVWTNKAVMSEAKSFMLAATPGPWRNYEVRVCIPAYYVGTSGIMHVTKANMLFARSGHATALLQGKTYVAGGNGNLTTENPETEQYDPETNSWARSTDFPVSTMYSGSYFTLGGKFYRATGGNGLTTAAYSFEPITKAWSAIGSVNTGRNRIYTGNGKVNGYGYIIGGYNGADVTTIEQYNPSTNVWTLRASITGVQTGGVGTGGAGGYLWRLCGFQNGGGGGASNITEAYNDTANTWLSRTNFPMTSETPATKEISQDALLAMGGYNGSYFNTSYEYSLPMNLYLTRATIPTAKQAGQFNGVSVTGGSNGSVLTEHTILVNSIKQALLSAGLTVT